MRRSWLGLLFFLPCFACPLSAAGTTAKPDSVGTKPVAEKFMQSSGVFIENRGQWPDETIRFVLSSHGVNAGLTDEGPRFQMFQREPRAGVAALWRAPLTSPKSAARLSDDLVSTGSLNPFREGSGGHQSAAIPDAFQGIWRGEGRQFDPASEWSISICITGGDVGSIVGIIAYPSIPCGGELRLLEARPDEIRLGERRTYGNCVDDGRIVLRRSSTGLATFDWYFADGTHGGTGSVRQIDSPASEVPSGYVGVWRGWGESLSFQSQWSILIAISGGKIGSVVGTFAYPSLSCGGELILTRVNADSIEVFEKYDFGTGSCVADGTDALKLTSSNTLDYRWYQPDGVLNGVGSLELAGARLAQAGFLKVTITPAEAIAVGAEWRRVGTAQWFNSGETQTDVPVGQHTLEFNEIVGWLAPAPQTVTITAGETTTAIGTYILQPLSIEVTLAGAYDTSGYAQDVAVSGNYAFVADGDAGLQVIDISDPARPVRVGGYDTSEWAWGVAVSANYAYVTDVLAGLQVIDISDPARPVRVGGYDTGGEAGGVAVSGNYAYMAATSDGLQVIDISDPANPARASSYDTGGEARDVAVSGNYAYVAHHLGLQVIDIRDPASPVRVGKPDTSRGGNGVAVLGNYAYLAGGQAGWGAGLQVIDIGDPANPILVGGYDTSGSASGVAVSGNYAYVADGSTGLQVIDIHDPAKPVRVGGYDTAGFAEGVAVSGNYLYVADGKRGLQMFRIEGAAPVDTGALVVKIGPPEVVAAGAQWRRAGTTTWHDSGDTKSDIPVGQHTIEFKEIAGWLAPAPQTVTITAGQTATVSATYARGPSSSSFAGLVVGVDSQGRPQGPLNGATVELTGVGTATTDARGEFRFSGLNAGTFTVTASKPGYYSATRTIALRAGETKYETLQLTAQSAAGTPTAFDFASPNGRHFIEGMPGNLSFGATVVWNGSPGSVAFNVAGTRYPAAITDLGSGLARASLTIAAPSVVSACSEITIEVSNGEGQRSSVNAGAYFHPVPAVIPAWYRDTINWSPSGSTLTYSKEASLVVWRAEIPSGVWSSSALLGYQRQLRFDPLAGAFRGSLGGFGTVNQELEFANVENLGEGRLDLSGSLDITLAACNPATATPSWELSFTGKAGIGAPAVLALDVLMPGLGTALSDVPLVGDLKLRLFLIGGLGMAGEYAARERPDCFLGTTSLDISGTIGLEGQAALDMDALGAEAAIYVGGTGTPEFRVCPELEFEGLTLRAYVGVFASAWLFEFSREVGAEIRFEPSRAQTVLGVVELRRAAASAAWQPIGGSYSRWGEANRLVETKPVGRVALSSLAASGGSEEEVIVENVTRLASPAAVGSAAEAMVLYSMHDPTKPWHAATDIGTVRRAGGGDASGGRCVGGDESGASGAEVGDRSGVV